MLEMARLNTDNSLELLLIILSRRPIQDLLQQVTSFVVSDSCTVIILGIVKLDSRVGLL